MHWPWSSQVCNLSRTPVNPSNASLTFSHIHIKTFPYVTYLQIFWNIEILIYIYIWFPYICIYALCIRMCNEAWAKPWQELISSPDPFVQNPTSNLFQPRQENSTGKEFQTARAQRTFSLGVENIFPQTALELSGVLNSSKKQALFHHDFPVPARVPGLVSLLFEHPVPSSFPAARVPGLVSLLFWNPVPSSFSWFRLGFRGLSPYSFGILFHYHFLVPGRVSGACLPTLLAGSVSLLFWHPVPSSFPDSG